MGSPRTAGLVVVLVLLGFSPAESQIRARVVSGGFVAPTGIVQDPLDPATRFIVEQRGLIRVLTGAGLLPQAFLDLTTMVSSDGERGLLGLAFPSDHAASRRFYVCFTDVNGHTVVARFRRSAVNPFVAEPASRFDFRWPSGRRIIEQPFANHNGGHMAFGPDGYLYVGLGDGGSSNDPDHRAQDPFTLLGKMLRLDVAVPDADPNGYRIPPDNPFVDGSPIGALAEIWAFGLRNPWRFSFDEPALGGSGALVLADVGQSAWEEINYEPAGAGGRNYGWRNREGANAHVGTRPPAYVPLTDPIHQYAHMGGASVTGGFVYRGSLLGAAFRGRYFFADFIKGRIWSLGVQIDPITREAQVINIVDHTDELGGRTIVGRISTFGVSQTGELFFANHQAGQILQIVPASLVTPGPPSDLRASVAGQAVTLDWTAPETGGPLEHYLVEAGSIPGATDLAALTTGLTPRLSVTGVPAGNYFVRVRGVNAAGTGQASNEILVSVGGSTPCGVPPGPPTDLRALKNGLAVTLTWRAPPGPPPDAYEIEVGSVPGARDLGTFETAGSVTSITGMGAPGRYFIRLHGRNACGRGPASQEIDVILP